MKYTLTNHKYIDGVLYKQLLSHTYIKGVVKPGELGGWVNNNTVLSQDDESWINPDSIVTDSIIRGKIHVFDSTISNSNLQGILLIKPGCNINNSKVASAEDNFGIIERGTVIENKIVKTIYVLDNRITNTNYWHVYKNKDIIIYCGDQYCKAGCTTATYLDMWNALQGKTSFIADSFTKDPTRVLKYTKPENLEWLKSICKQELERLNIKV